MLIGGSMKKFTTIIINYITKNLIAILFIITNLMSSIIIQFTTINNLTIRSIVGNLLILFLISSIGILLKPRRQFIYFGVVTIIFYM